MNDEAAMIARAVREGRPLASLIGVPLASLESARAIARWAEEIREPGLALAAWEGCAALDDAPESWLGLATCALALGDASRAWHAARRVGSHATAGEDERARALLLEARACLLGGREDDARRALHAISSTASPEIAALARAIDTRIGPRAMTAPREAA